MRMAGSRHLDMGVAVGFSFADRYGRMGTVDGVTIYTGDYNMKKYIIFLLAGMDIISIGVAFGVAMWITRRESVSVAIIGGADGPASMFLRGR